MGHIMPGEFSVTETHGILLRPENRTHASSRGLGWTLLYASSQREKPYEDRYNAVDDHLIILHLDGPVAVTRVLGKVPARRVIPPGGLFILPGGHEFGVRLEGELDSVHVYLRKQILDDVAEEFGYGSAGNIGIIPSMGDQDPLIERLALGIQEALLNNDTACSVYADYLARALAARLLRQHSTSARAAHPLPQGGFSRLQLKRATDFMQSNLGDPLTMAELATATGLSPSHFARRFKVSTGVPPHQFLMQMRVERAKRMLRGGASIIEIALTCGFTHQEHMTRIFRRAVGLTPAAYRRSVQS
jgi:AraC family transcriptional regulator